MDGIRLCSNKIKKQANPFIILLFFIEIKYFIIQNKIIHIFLYKTILLLEDFVANR